MIHLTDQCALALIGNSERNRQHLTLVAIQLSALYSVKHHIEVCSTQRPVGVLRPEKSCELEGVAPIAAGE